MSITVLNNISSLIAENAVSNTQASLQNTLQELSTGLKINSGADDPAGLSFADGLGANISALNESSQNATNGIGLLQTADGALSQVTTILNQAVQIATEASNGGLTTSQSTALSTEFNAILDEINQIGSTTNFNGTSVFGGDSTFVSSNTTGQTAGGTGDITAATQLTDGAKYSITDGADNFTFTAGADSTVGDLQTAIADAASGGTLPAGATGSLPSGAALQINDGSVTITGLSSAATISETGGTNVLGAFTGAAGATTATGSATGLAATAPLPAGDTFTINGAGNTFSYTAAAGSTLQDLVDAINNGTKDAGDTAATLTGTASAGVTAKITDGGSIEIDGLPSGATVAGTLTGAASTLGTISTSTAETFTAANTTATTPGASGSFATGTLLTAGSVTTITDAATAATGATPFTFTAQAGDTIGDLQDAINTAVAAGTLSAGTALSFSPTNQVQITAGSATDVLQVSTNDQVLGSFSGVAGQASNSATVFTSDGTTSGAFDLTTAVSNLSAGSLGLNNLSLNSAADAQTALTAISNAIDNVAALRGSIGASVNTLTSVSSVETTEVQNLTSAQNNVQNADIASTTSNLTQYNILEQTGFAALSQAQSAEQNVLKLLQG